MNRRKLNLPIFGFIVLTTSLMLVFAVYIVSAGTHNGWGKPDWGAIDQVYYSVSVWNLNYNPVTKITSSEHSLYLSNGEAAQISYDYEFKHYLTDIGGYENTLTGGDFLNGGGTFSKYSKQLMSVNNAPPGWHTLRCYTRVGFSRQGVGDGYTEPESINFQR